MRTPIIAGNWKMNMQLATAAELVTALKNDLAPLAASNQVEIVLCPPFVYLPRVAELVQGTRIGVGAQNMYFESKGAFTGEIAPAMVADFAQYVIIGHSERRQYFHETDESVNKKIRAALAQNLKPIVCVGEALETYEMGETDIWVRGQIHGAFKDLTAAEARALIVAYEPLWAIGTGKAATGAGANAVIGISIRGALTDLYGEAVAQAVRVQYGGSVTAKNIDEFIVQPDIDGALVGGASLKADEFSAICRAGLKKFE
ncbi:MAG: triose-phosphate isomerase [Chloroflexi bacterium UTCFX4]|jgi:triosephosphate isomerase|nr:MAG: triose-phosphate isomerase [Chloroflexi bacterium UTCFX4]